MNIRILHIAWVDAQALGGVSVAVPQMLRAQSACSQLGLVNLHGSRISGVKTLTMEEYRASGDPLFTQPELVVFHELYRPAFLGLAREFRKRKIPYVVVPHGGLSVQAQKKKWLKKTVANALLFGPFVRGAVRVQFLSENEARMSKFRLPHFVAGNGISIPALQSAGSGANGVRMVFIGRMELKIKGLDLLAEAVARMAPKLRQARCTLALYGPDVDGAAEQLRQSLEHAGVRDLVTISGSVVGAEKEAILLGADYFIQPSRTEGMPMGVLEALGYGIPCILTRGTGLADAVEQSRAGFGCETSADGLCAALERAISPQADRTAMSRQAAALARERYDSAVIARQTVEMYTRLIENNEV